MSSNDAQSDYELGCKYCDRANFPQLSNNIRIKEAKKLLKRSADAGCISAMKFLSECYKTGHGIGVKNEQESARWAELAKTTNKTSYYGDKVHSQSIIESIPKIMENPPYFAREPLCRSSDIDYSFVVKNEQKSVRWAELTKIVSETPKVIEKKEEKQEEYEWTKPQIILRFRNVFKRMIQANAFVSTGLKALFPADDVMKLSDADIYRLVSNKPVQAMIMGILLNHKISVSEDILGIELCKRVILYDEYFSKLNIVYGKITEHQFTRMWRKISKIEWPKNKGIGIGIWQ